MRIRINGPATDTTAPRVTSITRRTQSPTNQNTVDWYVTFDEDVKNVDATDFEVSNTSAMLDARVSSGSMEYVVEASGGDLADLTATVTLSFASGQNIQDLASNDLTNTMPTGTDESSIEMDNTAPTVTITAASTSTGPFEATFTFDEAVTGFAIGDITVGNGAPSNLQNPSSDNRTFTATITPVATGTVTLNVAADVAMDAVGNGNTAAIQVSISHTASVADTTAPTVTSIERQTPTTSPTNADTLTWRVTFNEDVKDVGDADFAIAGTTETLTLSASAVSGSASQYDVTVSGAALADLDATLTLSFASGQDIKDIANNNLTDTAPTGTNDFTFVVDNTAPTVTSIERLTPTTSPTNVNSLSWRVTFSEALPFTSPGPGTDDFVVSGTTDSLFIQPRSSTEFIVGVGGGDLDDLNDTVTLTFATGQNITDPAGNALVNVTPTSGTNDNFFLMDNTAPTVTITAASTSTGPFTATFTFDEAVTGFILGDITVGNGAPSNLQNPSSDNRTFTATITPVATGTVTVNVAADVAEDAAGNGNTAAIQVSISHTASVADTTAPTVTSIVRQDPTTSPTNANTLTWRVTFNEDVKDVGDADFEIAGTTAGLTATAMTGSTRIYDVTASGGNLDGLTDTVTLSFATGQDIKDNADNPLTKHDPDGDGRERLRGGQHRADGGEDRAPRTDNHADQRGQPDLADNVQRGRAERVPG